MKEYKKDVAIVPGSFDPITNGHVNIVKRAADMYGKVYLAVMINPSKQYMFTIEERKSIAEAAVIDIPNVEVITSEGMLWELTRDLGANAIVKGYRNETDLEYEKKMAEFNSAHYPDAPTVLLKADAELIDLSSTAVRELINRGDALNHFLPDKAIEEINKISAKRKL